MKNEKEPTGIQMFGAACMVVLFLAAMTAMLYRIAAELLN